MTLANERGVEGRGAQWANTGGQAQIKKVCFHTLSVNSHPECDFTLFNIFYASTAVIEGLGLS